MFSRSYINGFKYKKYKYTDKISLNTYTPTTGCAFPLTYLFIDCFFFFCVCCGHINQSHPMDTLVKRCIKIIEIVELMFCSFKCVCVCACVCVITWYQI